MQYACLPFLKKKTRSPKVWLDCDTSSYCFTSCPTWLFPDFRVSAHPGKNRRFIWVWAAAQPFTALLHTIHHILPDSDAVGGWMRNCFAVSKYAHLLVCKDLIVGKCDTIVGKFQGKLVHQQQQEGGSSWENQDPASSKPSKPSPHLLEGFE